MENNIECEYGCVGGFRIANARMCDSKGKEILCKCGRPISMGLIGKESYISYCSDCAPIEKIVEPMELKNILEKINEE